MCVCVRCALNSMSKDDNDNDDDAGSANNTDSLGICSFATMNYEWPEVNIT